MKVTIDRFEGKYAVVETESGEVVNMERVLIPADACEGDVIGICIDEKGTNERKNKINKLMNSLFED